MSCRTVQTLSWECCPEEIIRIILKHLSTKCLLACMTVNRRWKYIVTDFIESRNLWPKIASKNLPITFRRKSVLDIKNLLMNSLLWPSVSLANIALHHTYDMKNIGSMHVYKGNLILMIMGHNMCTHNQDTQPEVKYFDITNKTLTRSFKCTANESQYTENDYMVAFYGFGPNRSSELHVYGKTSPDDISVNTALVYAMNSVLLYRLEDDICYVVTERDIVWALTWNRKNWDVRLRGRYYGNTLNTICGIHVLNGRVSMVTKYGWILCEDPESKTIYKAFQYFCVPHCMNEANKVKLLLFNQTDIAVSVSRGIPSSRRVVIGEQLYSNHIMLACSVMTCAIEHGNMLFIGFQDGGVVICTPEKMRLSHDNEHPDRLFFVQDFDKSIENPCVIGLEVYEDNLSHHLFVGTQHKVLQLLITYPDDITVYYDE